MQNMSTQQEQVERQFSENAEAYLTSVTHAQGADLEQLQALAQQERPGVCLDLGAGAGHVTYTLAPYAGSVVAYDMSASMLAIVEKEAQQRGLHQVQTQVGKAEHLPFADQSFDWVISRYSAHHWGSVPAAMREVARVLRPNGRCIIMDNMADENPLLDTFLQTIEIVRDHTHVRDYRLSEWIQFFAQAGIQVETFMTSSLVLEFESWVQRSQTPSNKVKVLRDLLLQAPPEVKDYFKVEADASFAIPKGWLVGRRPAR